MRHLGLALLLASACTGSLSNGGGGGGGGGDDDTTPPPNNTVAVFVADGATPQANVRVLFQGADGSVVTAMTDATGTASTDMPVGGNVTVIRTYAAAVPPAEQRYPEVLTYVGVKPGDQLHLGHEIDDLGDASAINVKVPLTTQGTVKVVTPCGTGEGTAPNVPISVTGCASQLAFYVSDGNQSSFLAHAAYGSSVDLSTQHLTGSLAMSLSATNLTDVTSVRAEARLVDGAFTLFSSGTKRVDGGAQTVNMPNLQTGDELVVGTIATAAGGTQMIASRRPYAVTPTIIDASANRIASIDEDPMVTPTTITWLEGGTGEPDFVIATIDVTRGGSPLPTDAQYTRTIIAPHAGMSLAIPPSGDASFDPTADDQLAARLGLVQATGGYDALRGRALSVSNIVTAAPMGGTVTLSYAGNNAPEL
jgi:hypothetical protein